VTNSNKFGNILNSPPLEGWIRPKGEDGVVLEYLFKKQGIIFDILLLSSPDRNGILLWSEAEQKI
jgi:hypothetical protein